MERPLHSLPRYRNELLSLARALLYAEQSVASHVEAILGALVPAPGSERVRGLAGRTLAWSTVRPQPRAKVFAEKLRGDGDLRTLLKRHALQPALGSVVPRMRRWPGTESLPAIETVGELAAWLRVDVSYLLWLADLSDRNALPAASPLQHYSRRVLLKSDGSVRLVEAPKQLLKHAQRQILQELLALVPVHDAVHGFRKGRSTLTFARPHTGKEVVLRLDLKDFFPTFSGARVQGMFRTLGYPENVADVLGGLCTTTTPRRFWRCTGVEVDAAELGRARAQYARPHLPQGAPCSPALANLCALRLDKRLAALAEACGAVYTRYADDLAFSGDGAFARSAARFGLGAAAIALEEGFAVHHRKTRLMRKSVRQHLAGLTVNERPNVRRDEVDRLKATLVNCVRHGPETQNREGHRDFRAYLAGKVAYVSMVNPARGAKLAASLGRIEWS